MSLLEFVGGLDSSGANWNRGRLFGELSRNSAKFSETRRKVWLRIIFDTAFPSDGLDVFVGAKIALVFLCRKAII